MMTDADPPDRKRSRPPPGGPAALAGFLYQLLGSADWAVRARFTAADRGGAHTLLILEPAGGGDARHGSEAVQYKRRSRAWTVTSLINDVLPDLFKAAADGAVTRVSLQTDAPYGDISALRALIQALREGDLEPALRRAHRQGVRLRYRRGRALTPAVFFAQAGAAVAGTTAATFRRSPALRARFRRLLVILELAEPRTGEEMREAIKARLRPVIPYPESAARVVDALLGRMADEASRGEAAFDLNAFLRAEGVSPAAAGDAAAFARNLGAAFAVAMGRLRYDEAADCRDTDPLQPGPRPLAIGGTSGAGKTWLLARAAFAVMRRGGNVIWLENLTSLEDVQRRIADAVQAARGVTPALNPSGLRQVLEAIEPEGRTDLIVCLDRFANLETALRILRDPWWSDQGATVMGALPACDPDLIQAEDLDVVAAPVFTPSEVRRLLRGRRLAWAMLPGDIRRLLERPLMARLYQGLKRPSDGRFVPSNEYELMWAVWTRAPFDAHQGVWRGAMAKLATWIDEYRERLQDGGTPVYPWPVSGASWSTDERDVLERQGLLRWADGVHLSVDHDRLLAWGLAASAATAWRRGALRPDVLLAFLERCGVRPGEGPATPGGSALGYVLADFLWLALRPHEEPHDDLLQVMRRLRRRGREGWEWATLSTLGERGFRLILRMIEDCDREALGSAMAAGEALSACATSPLAAETARIARLLETRERREAAAAYFALSPTSSQLLRLIQLRAEMHAPWPERPQITRWLAERSALFAAAQACARAVPDAFLALIPRLSTPEELTVAAWVAAELPPLPALHAWRHLRPAITLDRLSLTALFAGQDLDAAGERDLEEHARTDVFSFAALARVRPDLARILLPDQSHTGLDQLDELLRTQPEALDVITARVAAGDLVADDVALAALRWAAWVTSALADALIDKHGSAAKVDRTRQLLAEAPSLGVLATLEHRAGSAFEQEVQGDALKRSAAHQDRNRDSELGYASAILLRIGGEGFEALTAARLRHAFDLENRDGVDAALVAAGSDVVAALVDHARKVLEDSRGSAIPSRPFHVLAAVAPNAAQDLAAQLLEGRGREEGWIAADIALQTEDADLAQAVLPRFGEVEAEEIIFQLRLLDLVDGDRERRAGLARRLLATRDSHQRVYAAWAAARMQDAALLDEVTDQLLQRLNGSYDSSDLQAAALLLDTEAAPRLLVALKGPRLRPRLRSLRAGLASDPLDAATADINDDLRDAAALEDNFLNIPREGLARLWRADPDAAFEVFEEGLRRGGRTSEGAAARAFQADGARALAVMLQRLAEVTEGKARLDAARATRAYPQAVEVVGARLDVVDLPHGLASIEVAGWMGDAGLDARLDAILRRETRQEHRKALHAAMDRSARIRFLKQLDARIGESDPGTRRRLLAVALRSDVDGVLTEPDDPLYVGRWLQTDRDHLLVAAWTRR